MQGEEVDRKRIDPAAVADLPPVDVGVELGEAVDVRPDLWRVGVENVRAIDVLVATGLRLVTGEAIAADVVAFLDDLDAVAGIGQFVRADGAVKPGSDDEE